MSAICHLAGLKGRTTVMIDWSDLGPQAQRPLCRRLLLQARTASTQLGHGHRRTEPVVKPAGRCFYRMAAEESARYRPVLCCWPIRASDPPACPCCAGYRECPDTLASPWTMWRRSKAMSASRPPTAIGDCWESIPASWSLCVSARGAISFRWGGGSQLSAVLESGASGTLVSGNFAAGRLR